jgi:catecholate siderophore receptor
MSERRVPPPSTPLSPPTGAPARRRQPVPNHLHPGKSTVLKNPKSPSASKTLNRDLSIPNARVLSLGALAAGFGLLVGTASAQTPTLLAPPASNEGTTLREIKVKAKADVEDSAKESLQTIKSTIGKGRQDIRDIPQSLTVMTEKLIDDVKLDTLRQALHYTAGITFAATENGTDQDIRLRGFPVATTGDLLIDGMKDPSQYDRDSFNYDRIEVLRGSASMLFGRGSTGGVINQVTKKPELVNLNEVVTTIGTGRYVRTTGDFNVRLGETSAIRLNAMFTLADNHGAKIDKQGLAPTMSWGLSTADEFTLGAFLLNSNNVPMSSLRYLSGSVASSIPAKNFYGTASDYQDGKAAYASGAWTHRFGDGGGELRSQFRSGVFKRQSWGTTAGYCGVALTAAGTCPAASRRHPRHLPAKRLQQPLQRVRSAPRGADRHRRRFRIGRSLQRLRHGRHQLQQGRHVGRQPERWARHRGDSDVSQDQ